MRFAVVLVLISLGLSNAGMWGRTAAGVMEAAKKLKENALSKTETISEKASKGAAALSDAGTVAAQVVAENTPVSVKDAGVAALGAAHGVAAQVAQTVAENAPAALGAAHGAALSVVENAPAMAATINDVSTVVSDAAVNIGNAVYNSTRDNIEAGTKAVGAAAQKLGDVAYAAANATLEASLRAIDAALQAAFGIGLKDVPGLIKTGSVHASNFGYFAFVCLSFGLSLYLGLGIYPAIFANVMVVALGVWRSARIMWHLTLKAVPLCGQYPGAFVLLTTVASFVLQWLVRRLLLSGGNIVGGSAARYHDLAGPNTRKLACMMGNDKLAATPLILLEELELRNIRAALQEQAAALAEQARVMSTLADKFVAMEEARAQLNLAEFEAMKKKQKDADLKSIATKNEQKGADLKSMNTKKEQ